MSSHIAGKSLINGKWICGNNGITSAFDPRTDSALEPTFSLIGPNEVDSAAEAAHSAFAEYRNTTPEIRSAFLDSIALEIDRRRSGIVERASHETGLPEPRLEGECTRTVNQLRLFAKVVSAGSFHRVRIDPAQPGRAPQPRADIRQRMIPLGPVGVFGASNFPLAFSTAGGDTASALAAGCPVVFKAHNAHPGTSELVAQAIDAAIKSHSLPAGVFSLIFGPGSEVGQALVAHPQIKAIGFTGSRSGGLAIAATAAARKVPIPVYAEMSSVNPVFVLPGALSDPESLAKAYTSSVTGSCGQLCTTPGLLFLPTGRQGDAFIAAVSTEISSMVGAPMLTKGIANARHEGVNLLKNLPGIRLLVEGTEGELKNSPAPIIFETSIEQFSADNRMQNEVFAAESLIIRYDDPSQLVNVPGVLEGQLTATIHAASSDYETAAKLLPELELIAGRILFNGWPTGVEVGHAMVHGGPFPATSDSRSTSVGTLAIERFLRPVAYQEVPASLQPVPIQDSNPWAIPQSVDGS